MNGWDRLTAALVIACLLVVATTARAEKRDAGEPLTMIVMDPLAAPLSCPCVEGYAQRKYEVLEEHLEQALGRDVTLVFAEALEKALSGEAHGRADLIIGKDSVVRADANAAKFDLTAVARLTDKLGSTTQHGLIVVGKDDPATRPSDLGGYRIFFGPKECDEKHRAALAILNQAGVDPPEKLEMDEACSDGACRVIELGPEAKAAAVISSYAEPLLEGCGTIKKGDLRVIAKTEPVPFVTAFVSDRVDPADRDQIQAALLSIGKKPEVCAALESLIGFVPAETEEEPAGKKG